jgi:uncharacterized membrane protein
MDRNQVIPHPRMTSEASNRNIDAPGDRLHRLTLAQYWIVPISLILGIYFGLPFLAPVFMHFGWNGLGHAVYWLFSFQCHQLPERSYFLFGPKLTYSLSEIQAAWKNTNDPLILRQFTGNTAMGWKVAWSDRMVSMYTSIPLFGLLWWLLRRWIKPLPWWGFLLFLVPMAIDGGSHFISDLVGIGQGFRDNNAWLAALTQHALPASFYAGDAWGSFNSLMRLLTGILFGMGIVWFGYPYIDYTFNDAEKNKGSQ